MKVVLFCGGAGMRLRGYVDDVPKPMVQIGTRPILWHLMKYYAHFGHKDFILCLGYKGNVIKDYFLHYDESISNDFVWSQGGKKVQFLNRDIDDWSITFVETGANSTIGERLKAVEPYLEWRGDVPGQLWRRLERPGTPGHDRCLPQQQRRRFPAAGATDGEFRHRPNGARAEPLPKSPLSAIRIFGSTAASSCFATRFSSYIHPGEELVREPFQRLIEEGALLAHKCTGFWQCMDTFKDKQSLEELNQGAAPWKVWRRAAACSGNVAAMIAGV